MNIQYSFFAIIRIMFFITLKNDKKGVLKPYECILKAISGTAITQMFHRKGPFRWNNKGILYIYILYIYYI